MKVLALILYSHLIPLLGVILEISLRNRAKDVKKSYNFLTFGKRESA